MFHCVSDPALQFVHFVDRRRAAVMMMVVMVLVMVLMVVLVMVLMIVLPFRRAGAGSVVLFRRVSGAGNVVGFGHGFAFQVHLFLRG